MSRQLADHLKSYGRDGDTELVHMTKGEIKGLQEIAMAHGGSLSINPNTGLVEAGFLKNILPAIAGAGLMMIPGMQAWGAGLIVGGAEALRTGDIGKGLTAGLGAYGGAGLGSAAGLGSSAASTAAPTATGITAGSAAAPTAAASAAPTALGSTANMAGASNALASGSTLTAPTATGSFGIAAPSSTLGSISAPTTTSALSSSTPSVTGVDLAKYGMAAAAPALAYVESPKVPTIEEEPSSGKYISKDFQAYEPKRPNPYYRPTGLGYAAGGQIDPMEQMAPGGLAALQGMRDGYGASQTPDGNVPQFASGGLTAKQMKMGDGIFRDTNPNTASLGAYEAADYYVKNAAKKNKVPYTKMPKANIEDLGEINVGPAKAAGGSIGGYSDGGRMLKGPGDGMSDDIPAVIGSKQPARLADGEFVVPADVVSHLGNGSTDAGAKKLYAMMDKVRQARTGTKKQGKQIKAEKYLPVKKMADGGLTAPAPSSSSIVTPDALAGLADLSALGSLISNTKAPTAAAPTTAPTATYNPAAAQVAAARAARPAADPVTFNIAKTKSLSTGYDNIKPDMLIDPEAAGWELYSSNPRTNPFGILTGDNESGGFFGRFNRSLSPAPEGSYTDSQGNVWIRKA